MLSKVSSAGLMGIDGYPVEIEVDVRTGLPMEVVVGLPDPAVRESKDRIQSALVNSGYQYPDDKITVNLAPADIRKEGPVFDLPIALGVLEASDQLAAGDLTRHCILGELALGGRIRPIRGALSVALMARQQGQTSILVPKQNAREAAIVAGVEVRGVESLAEVTAYLEGRRDLAPEVVDRQAMFRQGTSYPVDLAEVRGQAHARRALEVAVAGGHNLLMIGPPGSGKSMLARRIPTILPPMTMDEALETTRIHSCAGKVTSEKNLVAHRPFHAPHHTISNIGLVGGGAKIRPGRISLAHNGVLFLDEFPEFSRGVLEVLRQPLEDGEVTISRASGSLTFPARFMLVAAMNPCPCGYFTDPKRECRCTPGQIRRYMSRVSGPLLDRIDIHVEVPRVSYEDMSSDRSGERSAQVRQRVEAARQTQTGRFGQNSRVHVNAAMGSSQVRKFCRPDRDAAALLKRAMEDLGFSARAHDRVLKVARTIADLAGEERVGASAVAEALQYRTLDRELWL